MKRAGRFIIEDSLIAESPERAYAVMAWVIVLSATHHAYDAPSETVAHYAYEALGEQFTEIEDDAPLPLYSVNFYEGGQVQFYPAGE